MECEYACRHRHANTTGPALDLEPVPVLPHLLHLHDHVTCTRRWKRQLRPTRTVSALLTLDALIELVYKRREAVSRRQSLVLGFQLGADVVSQLGFHGHRAETERNGRIEHVPVGDASKDTRNPLFGIRLLEVEVLGSAVDGLEAVGLDGATLQCCKLAVGGKEVADDRTPALRLPLQKMEESAGNVDVQGDFVLVLAVQLSDVVLAHVLAQCDCGQDLEIVAM